MVSPGSTSERYPPGAYPPAAADEEAVDLRKILGVLGRHRLLIALVAAAVFAAAAYLALTARPQYQARAVIRLEDQRAALSGISGEAAEQVFGKQNDPLLSQLQVLRSRGVASSVVDQLGLRLHPLDPRLSPAHLAGVVVTDAADSAVELAFRSRDYELRGGGRRVRAAYGQPVEAAGVRLTVTKHPGIETAKLAVLDREEAVDNLLANLRATPREKTDVVDVEYTSGAPVLSQRVVNATVETFQEMNARTAQQQAVRRLRFAQEQLAETDSILAQAQTALTAFRERRQVFGSQQQAAAEQEGLRGVEVRRAELEGELRIHRALLQRLRQTAPGRSDQGLRAMMSVPSIASNPVIAQLYAQLVRYETSLDSLTAGEWGSAQSDPQVLRLTSLVASTRAGMLDAVVGHVSGLEARITSLDEVRSRASAQLQSLPAAEAEEARLVQRTETVRQVAQQLREEYQRARIAEAMEGGQVQIVDLAAVPRRPVGTGRGMKLGLGLALGLLLGSGGAFLKEHLNATIRPDEIEGLLGIPSLILVPALRRKESARSRLSRGTPREAAGQEDGLPELVTLSAPRSAGAEAFRTLRTNLLFTQAARALKTITVTSASPAEGKTTVSSNLAVAFAQQGLRVIVLDCDLRKPRLHEPFAIPRTPGLTDVALGTATLEDAVRATAVEGLSVLAAGTLPPNPAEFVGGGRMQALLGEIAERYDIVIVDTPPVLAAADAAVLASRADGTVIVLRAGQTGRGAAQHAVRQLNTVGARMLGAVVNDPDGQAPRSGYYYQYSGYYGEEK